MRPRSPCACGARYEDLRTGLTFATVKAMMRDLPDPNHPERYRSKRRPAVLGFWHELKRDLWNALHGGCVDTTCRHPNE